MITLLLLIGGAFAASWDPPEAQAAPFNAGILALQDGKPADAEIAFRQVLAHSPDCGRAAQGLGIALVRQERLDEARRILSQAASSFPDRAELHTALAGAAFAAQDFPSALEQARLASRLDPASVDAQVGLQQVLLRLGEPEQARAALAQATLPGPERGCLEILIDLEGDQTPGTTAAAYCQQAAHPGLASTVQARLSVQAGQLAATGAAAGRAGATTVEQVAQALRHHQHGQDAQALPLLDAALATEPRRIDARILRALVRARTQDEDGALADLEQVFAADSWVQVHPTGEMSGVLTASDEAALEDSVRQGAGLLVSLLVDAGRLDDAEAALLKASRRLGMGPALTAGAVRLRGAQDRLDDAWAVLLGGLSQWPEDPDLTLLAAELAARDPVRVPAAVQARLQAATDWRARYHLAVAAGRQGHQGSCAAQAEGAASTMDASSPPPTPADRVTVLRLWHACAVNAGLWTAADRAAAALGDPAAMNEVARLMHALMRQEAGDNAGAIELLDGLHASTAERRATAAEIRAQASGGDGP